MAAFGRLSMASPTPKKPAGGRQKGQKNFTKAEEQALWSIAASILPVDDEEWETVAAKFNKDPLIQARSAQSLKSKVMHSHDTVAQNIRALLVSKKGDRGDCVNARYQPNEENVLFDIFRTKLPRGEEEWKVCADMFNKVTLDPSKRIPGAIRRDAASLRRKFNELVEAGDHRALECERLLAAATKSAVLCSFPSEEQGAEAAAATSAATPAPSPDASAAPALEEGISGESQRKRVTK